MNEQNRLLKWGLVIVPLVAAVFAIYPPSDQLKGGIDLVGGTSLLYEIDTTGMEAEEKSDLANRVISILKRRVDPNGQLNLVWRPIGRTRIEIQMPRPPKEVLNRRADYNAALAKVRNMNINRIDIELKLNATEDEWGKWVAEQTSIVAERGPRLEAMKDAYKTYREAEEDKEGDWSVVEEAEAAYDTALTEVERTVLALGRLEDVLALQDRKERDKEIAKLKSQYSSYVSLMDDALEKHELWSRNKGALEDPSDLKRRIRGAGVLEFRILAEHDPANRSMTWAQDPSLKKEIAGYVDKLQRRGPRLEAGDEYGWFPIEKVCSFMPGMRDKDISEFDSVKGSSDEIVEKYAGNHYVLMHTGKKYSLLHEKGLKWKLVRAMAYTDPNTGRPAVSFQLDSRGGRSFGELTRLNKERQLAILLDGAAMSHATIRSQINERGQITGDFTPERVKELVTILEAGSLPARLKETPLMEYTIGPS
ncbi:MAG: hypothetical protein KAV82_16675, partial [Phycisphaerae bacterium]|nr:hypothetical protein [Phycisphaerae bacterium]